MIDLPCDVDYRRVPNFPDYAVRRDGTVWSSKRKEWRMLKCGTDDDGYHFVHLSESGKPKWFFVHRLVLLAFVGPPQEGEETCHSDGNPGNNCVENLRWGTATENGQDRISHGNSQQGETNVQAKLTERKVRAIRVAYQLKLMNQAEIARRSSMGKSVIRRVIRGEDWAHVQ